AVSIVGSRLQGQDNFRSPRDNRYNDDRRDDRRYSDPRIARDDPRYRTDGGRENVDDLLRSLIENELQRRDQDRDRLNDPLRNNLGSPSLSPNSPSVSPSRLTSPTREMLEARRVLADVTRDADSLAVLLNEDMRRVPGVRPYLDDVLRLRARVAILAERSRRFNDHRDIHPDLQELDRDWRLLSYRLAQLRGLDTRTITQIQRLNTFAKELGRAFEIDIQLDRQELLRKTAALSADLHNLMDDIEIEVPRSQQQIDLLLRGRRIEQQARQVANTVADTGDYQTVTGQYREFQRVWYPFATDLRPLNNRYLERGVRRVNEVDGSIHELLYLPQQMDREKLVYLSGVLQRDVDDFFVRAPLKLMINLPNSDRVLSTADEFYGVCENFTDVVKRGENTQQIIDAYHYIEDSWRSFSGVFRELKSQAAQQVLAEIGNNIVALGHALQVTGGGHDGGYDRHNALEIAASLDNAARHLENDIGRWLSVRSVNFRDYALQ
ncbi:MAG: hypothetical protein KDA84_29790, partial [Planctomycetaceae bacterium]|nr:hypothetical protein [Planctomycetaceae bacterium]